MRILFSCGSQAIGCDGVGDYTFGVAEELGRPGHEAIGIGIAAKFSAHAPARENR